MKMILKKAGKSVFILLLVSLLLPCGSILKGEEHGAQASISGFALPQYRKKDNRLQFILYGKSAVNRGALMVLKDLRLDIIRDTVMSVNEIIALDQVPMYPINSSVSFIEEYWKGKKHSHALLFTPEGVYDKNARTLRGDKSVHFRSRELDIDGVGFDAFHDRRFVHIRSNVRLVIRPEARNHSLKKEKKSSGKNDNGKTNKK